MECAKHEQAARRLGRRRTRGPRRARRRARRDPAQASGRSVLEMLRAADADALPPELQARVARHLRDSAWSRALVDGLREAGSDDRLDAESEDRLFDRITREAQAAAPAPSRRRWAPAMSSAARTRGHAADCRDRAALPPRYRGRARRGGTFDRRRRRAARAPRAGSGRQIAYSKPAVRLSPSALTWRGDRSANPFLRDLAPAFDAYRAGDHPPSGRGVRSALDGLSRLDRSVVLPGGQPDACG